MGSPAQALTFAKKHLQISQEVSQAYSLGLHWCLSSPLSSLWCLFPTTLSEPFNPKEDSSHSCAPGSVGQCGEQGSVFHLECWCPLCGFHPPIPVELGHVRYQGCWE